MSYAGSFPVKALNPDHVREKSASVPPLNMRPPKERQRRREEQAFSLRLFLRPKWYSFAERSYFCRCDSKFPPKG